MRHPLSAESDPRLSKAIIVPVACAVAVAASAALAIPTITKFIDQQMFGIDYLTISSNIALPLSTAYAPDPTDPFAYPPTTKLLLWPLAIGPSGYIPFVLVTAAAFLFACRKVLSPAAMLMVILSFPFINVMLVGQPIFLVVALMMAGLVARDRRLAGIALALAAAIKPPLVALIPLYLLATRDLKSFCWAGGTFCVLLVASVFAFGTEPWLLWPSTLTNYRNVILGGEVLEWVITPIGMAQRDGFPVWAATIYCCATALALCFFKYRDPVEALFGLTLGALLILPYGLPYNAVGLVPLLARNITRGKLVEILPFSMILPQFAIFACFMPIWRMLRSASTTNTDNPGVTKPSPLQ